MSESISLDGIPEEELSRFLAFREKVLGANISAQTLLATDYLNHFNEIVMLLDMVPDMPDILEEAKCWQPKSYQDHFRDSTFSDKELAVEAYNHVPTKFRRPFEETIGQMNRLVELSIERAETAAAAGAGADELRECTVSASRALQLLMDYASAIIHGSDRTMDQAEIDGLLG